LIQGAWEGLEELEEAYGDEDKEEIKRRLKALGYF